MRNRVWQFVLTVGMMVLAEPRVLLADPYLLDENDAVRLIAPGAPGLAGEYRLGEDGRIAIPLPETLYLGGLTLDEATEKLRTALNAEIVNPVIGLELVERRPFYIVGDVASPGAYPGVSGLTLDRAVAVAGGTRRSIESDQLQLAVIEIRSREELDRSLRERIEAEVRLARLEAELTEAPGFQPPVSVGDLTPDQAKMLSARETTILNMGVDAYKERLSSIERLLTARRDEIAALEGRLEAGVNQTIQIEQEIEDTRGLIERGLAPISRLNGLLREADRQRGDVLQIRVLLNQAKQAVAQLELDQANAPRERTIALTEAMSETLIRLSSLNTSIAAATDLIEETGTQAPAATSARVARYRIQRADGSAIIETEDGSLVVQPGDLITVLRNVPASRENK